jgi:hypothetical protein
MSSEVQLVVEGTSPLSSKSTALFSSLHVDNKMAPFPDYYAILDITPSATASDVSPSTARSNELA